MFSAESMQIEFTLFSGSEPVAEDASASECSDSDNENDEADEEPQKLAPPRARNRRDVVFSQPVAVQDDWEPTIIPKSEDQRQRILNVIQRNILFASLESEQV